MMPFSVLRIWGAGLISWAILAVAVYCLWEASRQFNPEPPRPQRHVEVLNSDERAIDRRAGPEPIAVAHSTPPHAWPYLAAGIGLLSLSLVGFAPFVLLLGNPGTGAPKAYSQGETKTIERPDGSRLHVEIHGPHNGPTLVFTHGWSLDSTAWYYLKNDLAGELRLVMWDLPGLGQSRGPRNGNYELEKMAEDLAAVVQEAGRGPIILVGHSIGGMIIQTFCRLYPTQIGSRVSGLVLLQTTYTNPLNTALGAPVWKAIEKPLLAPLNHLTIWLAPLAWLSNWQSFLNGSLHLMTRLASFSGKQTWQQLNHGAFLAAKAWPGVVARGNLAMTRFDEQATLPKIDVPVVVIAGHHDRMTKPSASGRIEQLVKHSLPFTVDAGHLGLWETHEDVAEVLREFAARFIEQDTPAPPTSRSPILGKHQ